MNPAPYGPKTADRNQAPALLPTGFRIIVFDNIHNHHYTNGLTRSDFLA